MTGPITDGGMSPEELSGMSTEEAMLAAAEVDGVRIVHRRERFPVAGTKSEKRAERTTALIFVLAFVAAVAFIVVFCGAVPFKWQLTGSRDYQFFTPLLGAFLGLSLACIGIGMVLWAKWLMPEEEAVQDRHDGAGTEAEQILSAATLVQGFNDLGVARRPMLKGSIGLAFGALGVLPLVVLVGGMIKKPNRGIGQSLFHTWYHDEASNYPNGVPIIFSDGRRVGPGDLEAGSIMTVFPVNHVREGDSPTLLIRLRPEQKAAVKNRKGQESFGWGDFVAYSKICTHAGCPASLYEQQTARLLCPCHQSQFDVLQDAKPVFGPATRSLPKLPLGVEIVNGKQYFVAKRDFPEAIGPAFWERP